MREFINQGKLSGFFFFIGECPQRRKYESAARRIIVVK
jgi:hypothetical protein